MPRLGYNLEPKWYIAWRGAVSLDRMECFFSLFLFPKCLYKICFFKGHWGNLRYFGWKEKKGNHHFDMLPTKHLISTYSFEQIRIVNHNLTLDLLKWEVCKLWAFQIFFYLIFKREGKAKPLMSLILGRGRGGGGRRL